MDLFKFALVLRGTGEARGTGEDSFGGGGGMGAAMLIAGNTGAPLGSRRAEMLTFRLKRAANHCE
jgi:hypothetical protein